MLHYPPIHVPDTYIRVSEYGDAEMAPRLRFGDRKEIAAIHGDWYNPQVVRNEGIKACLSDGHCYTVVHKERPSLIFGVSNHPSLSNVGTVWAMGTNDVKAFRKDFLAQSAWWLDVLHGNGRDILYNVVDARNKDHIRWLKWLGCSFIALHPTWGVESLPFYEFVHLKTHHHV